MRNIHNNNNNAINNNLNKIDDPSNSRRKSLIS